MEALSFEQPLDCLTQGHAMAQSVRMKNLRLETVLVIQPVELVEVEALGQPKRDFQKGGSQAHHSQTEALVRARYQDY